MSDLAQFHAGCFPVCICIGVLMLVLEIYSITSKAHIWTPATDLVGFLFILVFQAGQVDKVHVHVIPAEK